MAKPPTEHSNKTRGCTTLPFGLFSGETGFDLVEFPDTVTVIGENA